MRSIDCVAEFHRVFNPCNTSEPGGTPSHHVRLTRVQLITEELAELAHAFAAGHLVEALDALTDLQYVVDGSFLALGARAYEYPARGKFHGHTVPLMPAEYRRLDLLARMQRPLGKFTEALYGGYRVSALQHLAAFQLGLDEAFAACGLECVREEAFNEVHRSNMSKLGADGRPIVNEAGRVVKGPNYFRPDLRRVLGLPEETA